MITRSAAVASLLMLAVVALAAPPVADDGVARREKNLGRVGAALHAYHDKFDCIPANGSDAVGKPLLSWRVHLLPFLDQEALYKQFQLGEAWDGPHNKKLLARMPDVYAPARGDALAPGLTRLQTFTGPNTVWDGGRPRKSFPMIRDGLSNTIFVAEAATPVPWTKPADMEVTAKALPKLGGPPGKIFLSVFYDGVVRKIRRDFDEKTMRLAIDPRDKQPIDLDKISP